MALNRAIALSERDGLAAGLAALEAIGGLEHSHLRHPALAGQPAPLGRANEAAAELCTAVTMAPTEAERHFLLARLSAVISALG